MLIDIATASPPYLVDQSTAAAELAKRMGQRSITGRLIEAAALLSGIETRHIVIPDGDSSAQQKFYSENGAYRTPGTKARMQEYETWSKRLSCEAVQSLLSGTGCDPASVSRLIVVSCTGFFAPGIDYHLIGSCGIPATVKRTAIGFMGCAASIIGFTSALEALAAAERRDETVLLVSVELCSLHLQTEPTRDNILANMIFADGAAAALFSRSETLRPKARLELIGTKSVVFADSSQLMGWHIGDAGFEMQLSSDLPAAILHRAVPALHGMLQEMGLSVAEIAHWALHPGGRAILDALQQGLHLDARAMEPSRTVLRQYGNMSSASILFVLSELLHSRPIAPEEWCCAVAFGPGLSMEVAVMRGIA